MDFKSTIVRILFVIFFLIQLNVVVGEGMIYPTRPIRSAILDKG